MKNLNDKSAFTTCVSAYINKGKLPDETKEEFAKMSYGQKRKWYNRFVKYVLRNDTTPSKGKAKYLKETLTEELQIPSTDYDDAFLSVFRKALAKKTAQGEA